MLPGRDRVLGTNDDIPDAIPVETGVSIRGVIPVSETELHVFMDVDPGQVNREIRLVFSKPTALGRPIPVILTLVP
jgi:hypothetical protein